MFFPEYICTKLFQSVYANNRLWMTLQNVNLEPLLKKAKKCEKKYDWQQASDFYRKASSLALDQKDLLRGANFHEKMGFCFYRVAFQAHDNIDFK